MLQLLSPDGYYQYLGIRKPDANGAAAGETAAETVDEDMVRKNYRRLTLKHHPDRPNGDAETFRVLTRAKKVLTNSRLRQQYDLLGLDLDDDDDQATHGGNAGGDGDHDVDKNSEHNGSDNTGSNAGGEEDGDDQDQLPQTVLAEMASMTLAAMLQVIIRTGAYRMMIGDNDDGVDCVGPAFLLFFPHSLLTPHSASLHCALPCRVPSLTHTHTHSHLSHYGPGGSVGGAVSSVALSGHGLLVLRGLPHTRGSATSRHSGTNDGYGRTLHSHRRTLSDVPRTIGWCHGMELEFLDWYVHGESTEGTVSLSLSVCVCVCVCLYTSETTSIGCFVFTDTLPLSLRMISFHKQTCQHPCLFYTRCYI